MRYPPGAAASCDDDPARRHSSTPSFEVTEVEVELWRAQIEKLERANTGLRAKSREMKAAEAASSRVADLETQLADLQSKIRPQAASEDQERKRPRPAARPHRPRDLDPCDAVPPGVAVLEPAPLDEEAEVALESVEEHLGHR